MRQEHQGDNRDKGKGVTTFRDVLMGGSNGSRNGVSLDSSLPWAEDQMMIKFTDELCLKILVTREELG